MTTLPLEDAVLAELAVLAVLVVAEVAGWGGAALQTEADELAALGTADADSLSGSLSGSRPGDWAFVGRE